MFMFMFMFTSNTLNTRSLQETFGRIRNCGSADLRI